MTTGTTAESEHALYRRWRRWRIARRVVAVVAWYLALQVSFALVQAGSWTVGERSDAGTTTIEKSFQTDTVLGVGAGLVAWVLVALVWGQLARTVDYRWFDGLCMLIPLYNLYWAARIVWRLTHRISPVPVRDWPPASERPSRPQLPKLPRLLPDGKS